MKLGNEFSRFVKYSLSINVIKGVLDKVRGVYENWKNKVAGGRGVYLAPDSTCKTSLVSHADIQCKQLTTRMHNG